MNYPNEPIGGGNPYYRCKKCKKSDPEISVSGHRTWCEYHDGGSVGGIKLYKLWRKPMEGSLEPLWSSLTENQKILWEKLAEKLGV